VVRIGTLVGAVGDGLTVELLDADGRSPVDGVPDAVAAAGVAVPDTDVPWSLQPVSSTATQNAARPRVDLSHPFDIGPPEFLPRQVSVTAVAVPGP
jgi:hypothetical protein